MDPMDVLVLKAIHEVGVARTWNGNARDPLATKLNCPADEVSVSLDHLLEMGCITGPDGCLRPFGTLLMNVVSD